MTVDEMAIHCQELRHQGKGSYEITVWMKKGSGKNAVLIDLFQEQPTIDDNERFIAFDLDD